MDVIIFRSIRRFSFVFIAFWSDDRSWGLWFVCSSKNSLSVGCKSCFFILWENKTKEEKIFLVQSSPLSNIYLLYVL